VADSRRDWIAAVACVVGAFGVAAAWVLSTAFVGISDDDAARALIAWDFAHRPALDPTRSSWLPVHTYVLGAAMALTHEIAHTARALSVVGALVATAVSLRVARGFGTRAGVGAVATLAAALSAWSVFCALAPAVPEMPAVALLCGATAMLVRIDGSVPPVSHVAGAGVLLAAACGHRYECWFASAGVVVGAGMLPGMRWKRVALLGVLAASVPLAWLAMNHARAGNAFDFVRRVEAYRRAAAPLASRAERIAEFVRSVSVAAGAILAFAALGVWALRRKSAPVACALVSTLVGLAWTEWRGGGPTHHAGRTHVLAVWLAAPLAAAGLEFVWTSATRYGPVAKAATIVLALVAVTQSAWGVRAPPHDVSRDAIAAGQWLRSARTSHEPYGIETSRYEFLWVEMLSGEPRDARPDRPFGRPPPARDALLTRFRSVRLAAVHDLATAVILERDGFVQRARFGEWRLLARAVSAAAEPR